MMVDEGHYKDYIYEDNRQTTIYVRVANGRHSSGGGWEGLCSMPEALSGYF